MRGVLKMEVKISVVVFFVEQARRLVEFRFGRQPGTVALQGLWLLAKAEQAPEKKISVALKNFSARSAGAEAVPRAKDSNFASI